MLGFSVEMWPTLADFPAPLPRLTDWMLSSAALMVRIMSTLPTRRDLLSTAQGKPDLFPRASKRPMVHLQSPQFFVVTRHRSFVRSLKIAFVLLLLSMADLPAIPQDTHSPSAVPAEQILASYEGQNVSSIDIAGRPELTTQQFAAEFVQQAGQQFSKEKVDATLNALKAAGKFEEVRVQVDPEADGLRVMFILEPAVYVGIFQFPGAEQFPYSRLLQIANYTTEAPFNAAEIERDRQLLLTFFRQAGYFKAEVHAEVQVDSTRGIVNVSFHSTLGKKAKFGLIEITGVDSGMQSDLKKQLQSISARTRNASIRQGKSYVRGRLNRATDFLQSRLQKQGYLGAQVKLTGAEYHEDTNLADVHFDVNPGPMTHVRIEGAHLWPWTRKSLLPEYQGIGVDEETVQEGEAALRSHFQGKGYFDTKIESQMSGDAKDRTVLYRVTKGKKHKVASVGVAGESLLKSSDLTPHLTVEKKHFLSPGKFSDELVRSSVKNLEAVYQSKNFTSAEVTPSIAERDGEIHVTFRVTEGPRDMVRSLRIDGANTLSQSQYAPGGLKLAVGQPYAQKNIQADRTNVVAHYLKAGYLKSSFRETATVASKREPHQIDVVYHIYEGPRVFTADRLTLGRVQTKQRLIDLDVVSIKPDTPLTETDLLTAGSKLYEHSGVFDWAEVDPKRQIRTQTKEDVLVKVHEAKKNLFTYSLGFEIINRGGSVPSGTVAVPGLPPIGLPDDFTTSQKTFYGPRGSIQYTRNNIRGKGESLSFTAFAGRLDQRASLFYINPYLRWSRWRATTSLSAERNEENPVYSSEQEIASYQIQKFLDPEKKDLLTFRYSFSQTDLFRLEIPDLVPPEDQHVRLSTLAANFTRDTRDNFLDEHSGVLRSIELDLNAIKLGSSVNFAKLNLQAAFYKEKFHHIVWANSIRIGLAQPFADSRVPLSEKFFTGGGDSLRGFPLDGAGPQREVPVCSTGSNTDCSLIQVPAGGNELLIINSEARIPMPFRKGLSIVAFYDGGNVFPYVGFNDFTELYSNNVGLGLRYSTPVGPIRIDVGQNLNPVPGIKSTQYFISIGQAF